ncbi:DUF58 domain-containing protein [Phaeacidiphilus oryzae]|uniref:DUF58 domain-containing protein n=1 Tax=Phaeacidiphilus oryzae TaxID=348818 RepID=UPI000AAA04C6|nr:DUF58 domain-containing protein [Phaeacidiphilus oryzae]
MTAVAAALVTGHGWLLALAAGPLLALALAVPRHRRPGRIGTSVAVSPPARRCFERESIEATVTVRFPGADDARPAWIDPGYTPSPGVALADVVSDPERRTVTFRLTARRWGRWSLGTADLDLYDEGGAARRTVRVDLGFAEVFPVAEDASLTPVPVRLPERLGEHPTTQDGDGVEVVGVRPHVWGERQRRIHWPSTTRRGGAVQISQFAAERAVDTVLLLDACVDVADPVTGRSTLDDSLRVAAGIARAYLRGHDRVGVVAAGGGTPRWLRPRSGEAQFLRIVQSVLDVRSGTSFAAPELDRLPPPALPRGALVYAITPLADERFLDLLRDLAERGNPVVIVELAISEPRAEEHDRAERLAQRLWRIDRSALRFSLAEHGMPVVTWRAQPDAGAAGRGGEGEGLLDLALAPLLRTRVHGRTR